MEKLRFDPDATAGVALAATGLVATMTGRRELSAITTAGIVALAAVAARARRIADDLEAQTGTMTEQIRQLENAVAAQIQSRMTAESTVTSLSEQLSAAEHRAGHITDPIVMSLADAGEAGLTDPLTGLFNHEYFLVTLDLRIAAARRHLRPVAVTMLQVVERREDEKPAPADPALVAKALRKTLRESDSATRLSDGRFGVVLDDTPESGAIWAIERLRRCLTKDHPSLILWAGLACYPAHGFDVGAIVDRADIALTAAQEWHQDRIEVAVPE
jgi:GGDEF domain-containing protein